MQAPEVSIHKIKQGTIELEGISLPFGCFPLVIKGYVSNWRAFSHWEEESLARRLGARRVTCMVGGEAGDTFLQQVNLHKEMTLAEFLASTFGSDTTSRNLHLRIEPGEELWGQLEHDFEIPNFLEDYNPSATGIWLGRGPNTTPFHHDWWHSVLAQVVGEKRYTVVHPFEGGILQAGWSSGARFEMSPAQILSHHDQRLADCNLCYGGVLRAGEMLYIPPYWFHQIETLSGGNISLPIRFNTTQAPTVDLFQFSQTLRIRDVTNRRIQNVSKIGAILAENRMAFLERERAFIRAVAMARGLDEAEIVDEMTKALVEVANETALSSHP